MIKLDEKREIIVHRNGRKNIKERYEALIADLKKCTKATKHLAVGDRERCKGTY